MRRRRASYCRIMMSATPIEQGEADGIVTGSGGIAPPAAASEPGSTMPLPRGPILGITPRHSLLGRSYSCAALDGYLLRVGSEYV